MDGKKINVSREMRPSLEFKLATIVFAFVSTVMFFLRLTLMNLAFPIVLTPGATYKHQIS